MSSLPLNLCDAATKVCERELSATALVGACLEKIHQHEDRVCAWVLVDEENARREARRLDDELAQGKIRGPLHGIPIGVKDIFDVIGLPTQAGSPILRGNVARSDAPVVARLRRAGAVILGKTVTTEFACFDPPPTRNPWNLAHTPGGSSSGSAAALSAGMCLGALGSQTGGSITRPASFCGVCGLKPTFGRLSVQGVYPIAFHLDHPGPMARTIGDLAVLWSVLSDEETPPAKELSPPRLALLQGFFHEMADADARAATREAVERLQVKGATVETVALPEEFLEVHSVHRRIMAVEAAEHHRTQYQAHRKQYGPSISALIEEGFAVSAVDYAAALKQQSIFRAAAMELLQGYDALVTPATVTPAPPSLETTGNPAFNSPWSLAGLPTVSLPCGLSPGGMPCGLQLAGPWRAEGRLLHAAAWCEEKLAFRDSPPLS
jgi:aspartyl-tRNA(Asn)/glutamyl-tRNA(Gln) amidotransferase subunit A